MARGISLERVPLAWRLAALVAAPLLVVAIVAGVRLTELWDERHSGQELVEHLGTAALIETAISELQHEREATAHVLTLSGHWELPPELRADLHDARVGADRAIAVAGLSREVPPFDLRGFPINALAIEGGPLERVDDLRQLVDRRVLPPADVMHIYTLVIAGYLEDLKVALGAEGDSGPAKELLAYTSALVSAESFIQARAWGTILVASPQEGAREWILLATLAQTDEFFLEQARQVKPPPHVSGEVSSDAPPLGPPTNRRPAKPAGGVTGATISPLEWRASTQPRVDELNGSTTEFRERLVDDAQQVVAAAERELIVIAGLAVALIGLIAIGALRVSRSISRPLERLAVGARAASTGDLSGVELPDSSDAIGEIGRAYGLLDQYLHHVADSAQGIANGDLTREIKPRSPQDRLGMALRTMTSQLASKLVHSERRSAALEETVGELQETAARDPLTGLLNRGRFIELVNEAVESAAATNSRFGILFMDLDGFKPVNDQLGHAAGDELLRQVSSRLLGVLRVDDVVARLGGDEFTILISNGFDVIAVEAIARQIIETLTAPYFVHGETVEIGISVGLARYPEHGTTVEALLEAADQAMYAAKQGGGNEARIASADRAA